MTAGEANWDSSVWRSFIRAEVSWLEQIRKNSIASPGSIYRICQVGLESGRLRLN